MTGIQAALAQIEFVMEAVTFTEFIYEEALQTGFFALSNATRAKQYELGKGVYSTLLLDILPRFTGYVYMYGFISIYSYGAFKAFCTSSWNMLTQYRDLLELADPGFSEADLIDLAHHGPLAWALNIKHILGLE
jgi:hypothetical protein